MNKTIFIHYFYLNKNKILEWKIKNKFLIMSVEVSNLINDSYCYLLSCVNMINTGPILSAVSDFWVIAPKKYKTYCKPNI